MEDVRAVFEAALIWAYLVLEDFLSYVNKEDEHLEFWDFFPLKPIFGYPLDIRSLGISILIMQSTTVSLQYVRFGPDF